MNRGGRPRSQPDVCQVRRAPNEHFEGIFCMNRPHASGLCRRHYDMIRKGHTGVELLADAQRLNEQMHRDFARGLDSLGVYPQRLRDVLSDQRNLIEGVLETEELKRKVLGEHAYARLQRDPNDPIALPMQRQFSNALRALIGAGMIEHGVGYVCLAGGHGKSRKVTETQQNVSVSEAGQQPASTTFVEEIEQLLARDSEETGE